MNYLKILSILFLCFISTSAFSQRDFDYTFYTQSKKIISHRIDERTTYYDTIDLTITRKFTKDGSKLRQTSVFNTGSEDINYELEFGGWSHSKKMLHYNIVSINNTPVKNTHVYINPMLPYVIFISGDCESTYD